MEYTKNNTKFLSKKDYCCIHKCFNIQTITHVDGRACIKCNNFGYCICKCNEFKKSKLEKKVN